MTATWIADVLRTAGLAVVEYEGANHTPKDSTGWKNAGHPGGFSPRYVMWHHDASPKGPSDTLGWMVNGDTDLSGPCAQTWVDYEGTWHTVAAGLSYHAGRGGPYDTVPRDVMNNYAIGVETDHTINEPWPVDQLHSLRLGTAAMLVHMNRATDPGLLFHKTWAPNRKIDPSGLVLATERGFVNNYMTGILHPSLPPSYPTPVPPTPSKRKAKPVLILHITDQGNSKNGLYVVSFDAADKASGLTADDATALAANGATRLSPGASTAYVTAHSVTLTPVVV